MDDPRGYQGLETRIGKIRFLLDYWDAIWGPFVGGASSGGGSGLPPMLGKMARHPSVVELARCLDELERVDPPAFRHVKSYRCGTEWRNVTRKQKVKRPRGKGFELVDRRVREPIVPRWIDHALVASGERWLSVRFRGEVFIPEELWDAWTKPIAA